MGWKILACAMLALAARASAEVATPPAPAPAVQDSDAVPVEEWPTPAVAVEAMTNTPGLRAQHSDLFAFNMDIATMGAVALSDAILTMNVKPEGFTLPVTLEDPMIFGEYDAAAKKFRLTMNGGGTLAEVAMELPARPVRITMLQRNQLIFMVVDPKNGHGTIYHVARLRFRVRLPRAAWYALCPETTVDMGGQKLDVGRLNGGWEVEALDRLGPIEVRGLSPTGAPFRHRYVVDPQKLQDQLKEHLDALCKAQKPRA